MTNKTRRERTNDAEPQIEAPALAAPSDVEVEARAAITADLDRMGIFDATERELYVERMVPRAIEAKRTAEAADALERARIAADVASRERAKREHLDDMRRVTRERGE